MKAILTLGGRAKRGLGPAALALAVFAGTACTSSKPASPGGASGSARPTAVAAEDTWGNLLAQLAGDRVRVSSIIRQPGVDPHDYDPRPSDATAVADARLMVVNGVGYDDWATKLVDANPASGRVVIDVGRVVGARRGDNPHRWYVPDDVHRVVQEMEAALQVIAPADSAYFSDRAAGLSRALRPYDDAIARIRAAHAGTPIAVSESIFDGMAEALGLRVLTPRAFEDAVTEGNEPTARDKQAVDGQLSGREVAVFVYNAQNTTPDVRALVGAATAAGVPVATVTETLSPAGTTFQGWQLRQLTELERALASAPPR